jgi:hypothetical protein
VIAAFRAPDRRDARRIGVGPAGQANLRDRDPAAERARHPRAERFVGVGVADQGEASTQIESLDRFGLAPFEGLGDRDRAGRNAERRPAIGIRERAVHEALKRIGGHGAGTVALDSNIGRRQSNRRR